MIVKIILYIPRQISQINLFQLTAAQNEFIKKIIFSVAGSDGKGRRRPNLFCPSEPTPSHGTKAKNYCFLINSFFAIYIQMTNTLVMS